MDWLISLESYNIVLVSSFFSTYLLPINTDISLDEYLINYSVFDIGISPLHTVYNLHKYLAKETTILIFTW